MKSIGQQKDVILKPKKGTYILATILIIIGVLVSPIFFAQTEILPKIVIGSYTTIIIFGGVGLLRKMAIAWWVLTIALSSAILFLCYSYLFDDPVSLANPVPLRNLVILIVFYLISLSILFSDRPQKWLNYPHNPKPKQDETVRFKFHETAIVNETIHPENNVAAYGVLIPKSFSQKVLFNHPELIENAKKILSGRFSLDEKILVYFASVSAGLTPDQALSFMQDQPVTLNEHNSPRDVFNGLPSKTWDEPCYGVYLAVPVSHKQKEW
jgi:hypothetical protein